MFERQIQTEELSFDVMLGLEPESPFDEAQLGQISFRPTVIVGIGGTGLRVVRKLKKRIRRFFKEDGRSIFQFLVFDTDHEEQREDERLDSGEFVYLGNIDGNGIIANLSIHDYIRPWWPEGYAPGFISTGAKAVRCVGRLALFHYIDEIVPRIEDAIRRAIDVDAAMGVEAQSAKIYIIASLCGGTGSGMFIDMAYITRDLFMQRVPAAYVTGALVMPDAFEPLFTALSTTNRARANTYAALKELDHFTYHRHFKVRYSNAYEINLPLGHRPFDICYLLGATNENGQHVGDIEGLAEMIAEEIFLEIASPLRRQQASDFDNISELEEVSMGKAMAYSSFAVASLAYPVGRIVTWCAAKETARLIQDGLLRPVADSRATDAAAEAFLTQQRIREAGMDEVLSQLSRDGRGQPIAVDVQLVELEGQRQLELLDVMQGVEHYRSEELERACQEMDSHLGELSRRTTRALLEKVRDFTLSPDHGLVFARWFLEHLRTKVAAQRDGEMVPEAQAWSQWKGARESLWQDARGEVETAVTSWGLPVIKTRRVSQAVADYASAYNGYLQAHLELELRSRAITFYESLVEEIDRLNRTLGDLIARLNVTRDRARDFSERALVGRRVLRGEYVLARSAVDFQGLEELYQRYSPSLETTADRRQILTEFLGHVRAENPGWSPLAGAHEDEDHIGAQLYEFLRARFHERLAGLDLLTVLRELEGSGRVTDACHSLFRNAGPFWSFTTVDCPEGRGNIHPVSLIGYHRVDGAGSGWVKELRGAVERFTPVPTNDPYQLVILKTKHGLPLYTFNALRGLYRNAYEVYEDQWRSHREGTRPLHASEEWEKAVADIHPSRDVYRHILFAVGFGLDLIYNKGDWYYARARQEEGQPHKDDHQIAQGRRAALEAFARSKEARLDVDRTLRERMVSAQAETLSRLSEYVRWLETQALKDTANKALYQQEKAWVEQFVKEYRRLL